MWAWQLDIQHIPLTERAVTNHTDNMSPRRREPMPKKVALVCSGGAVKAAAFHMGVCLALQEKGFKFRGGLQKKSPQPAKPLEIDTYVGSSAGSFIASYLVAGYTVDQIFDGYMGKSRGQSPLRPITYATLMSLRGSMHEEEAKKTLSKKISSITTTALNLLYKRQKLLSLSGLFSTAGIESHLRNDVLPSNHFNDYSADLYVVSTQLNHSKRVIFNRRALPSPKEDLRCIYDNTIAISDAVAASTALPPIFAPYGIRNNNGKIVYFFDGEIRETLSVNVAEDAGADLIIASYTHQPYHFSREIGSLTRHGVTAIAIQAIYLLIERKIQHSLYARNQKLAALEAVSEYCKSENLSDAHRKKLCELLEEKLHINKNVKHIYIHPRADDHEMFFGEHFNLNPKYMERIVRIGFMSALNTLRHFDFSSQE